MCRDEIDEGSEEEGFYPTYLHNHWQHLTKKRKENVQE